jgi:hypothetical protein
MPRVEGIGGSPSLQRLELRDYVVKTLLGYLKDVNPRLLDLYCDVTLLASIAKRESGPDREWDKFSHIKQVKAHAHDYGNKIERMWYVKYTRDPFSFMTNISSGKLTQHCCFIRCILEYLSGSGNISLLD